MQKDEKKIVLTGGHAGSTAFTLIEELRKQKRKWDIYWIGYKSSVEGEKVPTLSSIYFPKYGIKTYGITSGRIQRRLTRYSYLSLLKIPMGFFHALLILIKINPDIILSFGGFSAFPVVVVGWLLRIPVIIHEQTAVVGRANRYSSIFAQKVAISRETSFEFFPKRKTVLIGNPIPKGITISTTKSTLPKTPVIFITGGQSGSVTINNVIERVLSTLLKDFRVIHLTGIKQEPKFKKIWGTFHEGLRKRYEVYGMVDPKKYDFLFNFSQIVISRAGANTVSKIIFAKKPSILIPLPISYLAEQEKNANYASDFGTARIINQNELTSERLVREVKYLTKNWKKITEKVALKESPDVGASEKLVELIEEVLR